MLDRPRHPSPPPRPGRADREVPGRRGPPSTIRLRLRCPDHGAYRARHEAVHLQDGVFIPSDRICARPVGTRLHLKIELADRTLAYSGAAVIAAHHEAGPRPGYVLALEPIEVEIAIEPGAPPPPARAHRAPPPLPARPPALARR